jgi:hypothetical protein
MKTNPLKEGVVIENSSGIGTVTRGAVFASETQLEQHDKE